MKIQKHKNGIAIPLWNRTGAGAWQIGVTCLAALLAAALPSSQASPHHDVAAANVDVIQNDTGNTTASVTVTTALSINDLRIRDGSIRGTYNIQIGDDSTDDGVNGILISSVRQNGRNNGETSANRKGTNWCFSSIGIAAITDPTSPYLIASFADSTPTTNVVAKYNINVAGAWFPYSSWVAGHVYIASGTNGGYNVGNTNDTLRGTAGLLYADNVSQYSAGKYNLNLTGLGIDSRTDGILLVSGGKNENNWCTSAVNPDDGSWDVTVKDGGSNGTGSEEDPFAFVFIPRTNTAVVSGRFLGNGSIDVYSGIYPQFTISSNGVGTYELKIPGYNPTNGVLIVSPDAGGSKNVDNMVTYEANAANDGWIIQSRDFDGIGSPLEAIPDTEVVASFVFIPADNDLPNLVLSPATLSVVEGQTNSYTVVLNAQPTGDVTVNIASADIALATVSPATLTFNAANWNIPQTVFVIGTDDLISEGPTHCAITNSVVSSESLYATVSPSIAFVTTLDNEAVISFPSGGAQYTIGSAGVGIDGRASIDDLNTPNYEGSTLTVTLTGGGTSDDRLEIRSTGTDAGQISVAGNTISYEGVAFATFTGGVGTTPLSVTFNAASNPTNAQALLQSVIFRNVSATPNSNTRTVSATVTHPDGGTGAASTTVQLSVINVISFQQNVDNGYGAYSSEADFEIHLSDPDTSFPEGRNALSGLFIDYPSPGGNSSQVLLRFGNLFGDAPGQIPTNAIIVSAELNLHIINNGDGSPLYRMLKPFDENTTWDSMEGGVDQNDSESRSAYDSIFGLTTDLTTNSPNTSLGTISFSVMSDILAWQGGEANYGWVLPGSQDEIDGTGISPGEDPNSNNRPRLVVRWLPAGTLSASFQQDVNGYAGAKDTSIQANSPDIDNSTNISVFVDWASTPGIGENDQQVLIRFDEIFGTGANQIPPGSTIHAAMLDLDSTRVNSSVGNGGTFHAMLIPWDETNTWNFFNAGIIADNIKAVMTPTTAAGNAKLSPNVQAAYLTFDLTSDVQAWSSGVRPNYGWVILPWPNGGDGWGFSTSNEPNTARRPRLRVFYAPGSAIISIKTIQRTESAVTITFGGEVGTTYSIRRAGTVDGTYTVVGTATVQPDGSAIFNDTTPLANAAFYRISNP